MSGSKLPRIAEPSASSASSAASTSRDIHAERCRDRAGVGRAEPFQTAAHDLAHRFVPRPFFRVGARNGDVGVESASGKTAFSSGMRSAATSSLPSACDASLRSQVMHQRRPRGLALDFVLGQERQPAQRIVQLVGAGRFGPGFARARARSLPDRACRCRPPIPDPSSAGSSPPACAVPRAVRRRDTRTAAPTVLRARAAKAQSGRAPRS